MLASIIYDFLKARGFPVGTERKWKDGLIRVKQGDGSWKVKAGQRRTVKKKAVKKKGKRKETASQYKDVGEKIGGARKDLGVWRKKQLLRDKSLRLSLSDGKLLEKGGQLRTLLTRDRQFGKIKELYDLAITQEAEENPFIGYAKIAFVDALPAKPPNTIEGRESYIAMTRLVTASLEQASDLESFAKIQGELSRQLLRKPYDYIFSRITRQKFIDNVWGRQYISYNNPEHYTKKEYIGTVINNLFHYENNKSKAKEEHEHTYIENEEQKASAIRMLDDYFSGSARKRSAIAKDKAKNPKPAWNRRAQVGGKTAERVGPKVKSAYTSKQLKDSFGFRGVEYGNWVKGETAKEHTHFSGMALADLSRALGIPPKEISLNGRLAVSFGGRGLGGKRAPVAHYEPLKKAINITREAGSGSLAHEWFHAMDNILNENELYGDGDSVSYLSNTGFKSKGAGEEQKLETSFNELLNSMLTGSAKNTFLAQKTAKPQKLTSQKEKEENWKELGDLAVSIGINFTWAWDKGYIASAGAGKEKQYERIGELSKKLAEVSKEKYGARKTELSELVELVSEHYPDYLSVNWSRGAQKNANERGETFYTKYANRSQKSKSYVLKQNISAKRYENLSNILACSKVLDAGKKKYWSRKEEIMARCFESYIYDKLQLKGEKNDYLVSSNISNESVSKWVKHWAHSIPPNSAPYPLGEERERINKAFDNFFNVLKEQKAFQKSIAYLEMLEAKLLLKRRAA